MTIAEITAESVRGIERLELLSLHRLTHQLFARAGDDALDEIRGAHRTLVIEMTRREIRHTSALRKSDDALAQEDALVCMTGEDAAELGALAEIIPDGECLDLGGGRGTFARMLQNSGSLCPGLLGAP